MRNIVIVNLESVNMTTYNLLPRDEKMQWEIWRIQEAYSMRKTGNVFVTGAFYKEILRDDLFDALEEYNKVFAAEWHYCPTRLTKKVVEFYPQRMVTKPSWFDDWLVDRFDKYINTYVSDKVDIKYTLNRVGKHLEEPYFLMLQAHDTHLPFKSAGVDGWYDWYKALEEEISLPKDLIRDEGLEGYGFIKQLCTLNDRGLYSFEKDPNRERIFKIFHDARLMQVKALIYVLDNLKRFVSSDVLFHFIGDHMTLLGDFDRFGNVHGDMSEEEMLRTVWLTNQNIDMSERYVVGQLPELLIEEIK